MNKDKLNLVYEEELKYKSYEELLEMEKKLMNNKETTDLDLAIISDEILDRELKMGIKTTIPWDKVIDELLKGTEFENRNKRNSEIRVATN